MIKEYTITVDGLSNGNVIAQPFKVKIHAMQYGTKLTLGTCTCNSEDVECINDDIENTPIFDFPVITTSKQADLAATIEVLLEEKYPGNWS
jgi:hypothetical protein